MPCPPPAAGEPSAIYEAYNASISDDLYTIGAGKAAGTPGYVNTGVFMYVERYPRAAPR